MQEREQQLVEALADMREDEALALARAMLEGGVDPLRVLELCRAGMEIVGRRFEQGEYFLPELILGGEMLEAIGALAKPLIAQAPGGPAKKRGRVLIGTVHGDLHDIGKNIVTFMLDINGYDVRDLGIDVPAATFIDAVREFQPAVIGLSGFLTLAFDSMRDTVQAIETAGLREGRKIMIGGGQVDEAVRAHTRADAFGGNAMAAVALCRQWIGA
ncbi:MAG: cobalamin-dependent protein [Burkholderiales bacterium]|nr:cobalamin-dependent protein [Burkholderiales bacterium]